MAYFALDGPNDVFGTRGSGEGANVSIKTISACNITGIDYAGVCFVCACFYHIGQVCHELKHKTKRRKYIEAPRSRSILILHINIGEYANVPGTKMDLVRLFGRVRRLQLSRWCPNLHELHGVPNRIYVHIIYSLI